MCNYCSPLILSYLDLMQLGLFALSCQLRTNDPFFKGQNWIRCIG